MTARRNVSPGDARRWALSSGAGAPKCSVVLLPCRSIVVRPASNTVSPASREVLHCNTLRPALSREFQTKLHKPVALPSELYLILIPIPVGVVTVEGAVGVRPVVTH